MKIGRNDPCPCGSGLKYKKCCAGKQQGEEAPAETSDIPSVLDELKGMLQGQNFGSLEEVNAFAAKFMQQRDQAAFDDFHGLSPEQMHRFLYYALDSPELVTFPSPLDSEPQAPIVDLFKLLAEGLGEEGLKVTATGNLPRNFCQETAVRYWGEEGYQKRTRYNKIRSERDFSVLHVTRVVCEVAGLIRKYKGKFILSRECRKILKEQGLRGVYPRLLRTFAREYNWGYSDGYPELPLVQQSFLFSLYLLVKYGGDWRSNRFYEDAFLQAFPNVLSQVPEESYSTPEQQLFHCYSLRVLRRFAEFLGLVEVRSGGEGRIGMRDEYELRKLPLLDQVVRFHL